MNTPEVEVARPVVEWLKANRWDVFHEVTIGDYRADIVAVKDRMVWIIEAKASRDLTVLCQAIRWIGEVHMVSVALPVVRRESLTIRNGWDSSCEKHGIGQFIGGRPVVRAQVNSRVDARWILGLLTDEHRNGNWAQAGSPSGGHYTPFQDLMRKLRAKVDEQQSLRLKDFIAETDHHYSSDAFAIAAIRSALKDDKTHEVRSGGRVCEKTFNRHTMKREA